MVSHAREVASRQAYWSVLKLIIVSIVFDDALHPRLRSPSRLHTLFHIGLPSV